MKLILGLIVISALFAPAATWAAGTALSVPPDASGTVAVLPIIDATGNQWKKHADQLRDALRKEAVDGLTGHGYSVIDAETVGRCLTGAHVDLTDEEQQKRDTLYTIGRTVHADFVMFVVIMDMQQKEVDRFFWTSRHGSARIKVWLLDVRAEQAVYSAKVFEGKRTGKYYTEHHGSGLITIAAQNAVKEALAGFFRPATVQP